MENLHRYFDEFSMHLMNDNEPSAYFNRLLEEGLFSKTYPFTLLGRLADTPQSPEHHPEGNVWNHTMLVVDEAAKRKERSENPQAFMWAALLHDLGKAPTTRLRKGRLTSYGHDTVGARLAADFMKALACPDELAARITGLVRWHMQILFVVKDLPFADIGRMASEVPVAEAALFGLCDRLGRGGMTSGLAEQERKHVEIFLAKCGEVLRGKG